ncbi:uncharacterized protein J4E84_003193 [Alternaria hordeiaustralica]|uniref:uncharacterized protein n=1 Tax=Alternaria hordeiaustralica TaxID=1187925 RepID=UPI0020C1FCA8|nr:uncharacterized protein J4E84_003193 [Alternaria hordeiaustralica]KAI4692225.1 hypothetical protein J4E84_003193 [Alternaria hordeiaustralica]
MKLREHLMRERPAIHCLNHLDDIKHARMAYAYLCDNIRNDTSRDGVLELWLRTCDIAAGEIQALCHRAGILESKEEDPTGSSDSVALLQKARKDAEEMISFLSDQPMCAQEASLASKKWQLEVGKLKSLLSFRAHVVCKALGDIDAAIGYLKEAIKHDPNCAENPEDRPPTKWIFGVGSWTHPRSVYTRGTPLSNVYLVENPVEMLDNLKAERGTSSEEDASRVVRWEVRM